VKPLGAIIAGGQSRRFGSDKREALLAGRPLMEHVMGALQPQTHDIIAVGRPWRDLTFVEDHRTTNGGALFGLCAALEHAKRRGFDTVLTAGCDTLPVPPLLSELLGEAPAVIEGQWLFGLWPAALADELAWHLDRQNDHSMRHWIAVSGARKIPCKLRFFNVNTATDLAQINLAEDSSVL
jgi:molybdenum cofactor guanylyltransferase